MAAAKSAAKKKARLNSTVYVMHEGNVVGYGPDSEDIPDEVASQIGDHAWEDGEAPANDPAAGHADGDAGSAK